MWIQRHASGYIRQALRQFPILVLTGARQTGKTALARHLVPDYHYVSLDLPSDAEEADHDPAGFLQHYPAPLIIDEVQYAPGLFRHVKMAVDQDRDRPGQYLLTGSQPFTLMNQVSESLAGRAAIIHLEGLSWAEIHASLPDMPIQQVLWRGGFPELYKRPDLDPELYHRSYVSTYFERDLRSLLAVGNLRDFERFVRVCALRTGNVLNRANLARDVGISAPTAANWISVLEASGQLMLLEPWFSNATKRLVKSPKLHLCDSGTLCFLCGIRSPEALLDSPLLGAIWETAVIAEVRRALQNTGAPPDIYYWRDRSREADLLLHRGGLLHLADAKWTASPDVSDAAQLRRIAREQPVASCSLLCRAPRDHPLAEDVAVISPWTLAEWAMSR